MVVTEMQQSRIYCDANNFYMSTVYYLAYGSNLHPYRLAERVPSVSPMGVVTIPERRIAFHKRSALDGSGKCMFYVTDDPSELMYGVLYEFDSAEKARLDALEGEGRGYKEQSVQFSLNGIPYTSLVYVAHRDYVNANLMPFTWYKEMILLGARYHRLPLDYIAFIEAIPSMLDPNRKRVAENEKILTQMRQINLSAGV